MGRVAAWIVFVGSLALFSVLRLYALAPSLSDESLYFYLAERTAKGQVPYRDFFFAHPPLHLLPLAGLFKFAGGYRMWIAKGLPFASGIAAAALVFVAVRRAFSSYSTWIRESAAAAAVSALVFSLSFARTSAYDTGVTQVSALLALATALLLYNRWASSGIAAGVAIMTLPQAAPIGFALGILMLYRDRKAAMRYILAAGSVVVVVHVVFLLLAGPTFLKDVYLYHVNKLPQIGEGEKRLASVLDESWGLFAFATAGTAAAAILGGPSQRIAHAGVLAVALHVGLLATRPRVFYYYFQPVLLVFAVLGACGVAAILAELSANTSWRRRAAAVGLGVLGLAIASVPSSRPARALPYQWRDAPLIGPANRWVRTLFWGSGGDGSSRGTAISKYLWRTSLVHDRHSDIVDAVRSQKTASPVTLFGDTAVAPAVAVDARVAILHDFADTNPQRFDAQPDLMPAVLRMLDGSPETLILMNSNFGIGSIAGFREFVRKHYDVVADFPSKVGIRNALYRRSRGSGDPPVQLVTSSSAVALMKISATEEPIPDEPKVPARLDVRVSDSASSEGNASYTIGIETRGDSSARFYPKPSYSVELRTPSGVDQPPALLGMRRQKGWVLRACYGDKSCLRDALAQSLWGAMGHPGPHYRFVELSLNDKYQGLYLALEAIGLGHFAGHRSGPEEPDTGDVTGAYIVRREGTGKGTDRSWRSATGTMWTYHFPKATALSGPQRQYLASYFDDIEALATRASSIRDLEGRLDLRTWIDFGIIQELANNVDGYWKSMYLSKQRDRDGGHLALGPVWDFDLAFGNASFRYGDRVDVLAHEASTRDPSAAPSGGFVPGIWQRLWADKDYRSVTACRWHELRAATLHTGTIAAFLDESHRTISQALIRDHKRWPRFGRPVWGTVTSVSASPEEELYWLKQWLRRRLEWLDGYFGACARLSPE